MDKLKSFFKEYGLYILLNILFFVVSPYLLLYFLKFAGSYDLAVVILAGVFFLLLIIFLATKLRNKNFRSVFLNTWLLFFTFLMVFFAALRYVVYFIPQTVQWFFIIFCLVVFGLFIHKLVLAKKNIFWKALFWYVLFFVPIFFVMFLIMSYVGIDYYEAASGTPGGFFNFVIFFYGGLLAVVLGIIFVIVSVVAKALVNKFIFLQKCLIKDRMKRWQFGLIVLICLLPASISFLSFKELGGTYYKVNGSIYALVRGQGVLNVERIKVDGADEKSFEFIGDVRARDKGHCYYRGVAVKQKKEAECYGGSK